VSVDRKDLETLSRGLRKRLLRDLPEARPGFYAEFKGHVKKWLRDHVKPVDAMEFSDWIASETSYNEARKEELRVANELNRGRRPPMRVSHKVSSFPKLESYPQYKECRWINSRHDRFKAYAGRFIKPIEEELYKDHHFIKHVPIPERPKLVSGLRKSGYRYYENDYKAYESSFVKELMLSCECQLYKWALQKYPEDAAYIIKVATGRNKLRTRAGVRVEVEARRMSGDLFTSLGNGFSNFMLLDYLATRNDFAWDGFVEGDDGLFATSKPLSKEMFEECGFNVEINEVRDPCLAHFCGMTFASSGQCIKDPRRVFQTFGWTHSFVHAGDAVMEELLKCKALSLCYEMPQCPIVGALGRAALIRTDHVHIKHWEDHYGMNRNALIDFEVPAFCPDNETRAIFEEKFHIPISTQIAIESLIYEGKMDEVYDLLIFVPSEYPIAHDNLDYISKYVEVG